MASLRLRYENGHFVPLEKVEGLNEGDEIEVVWQPPQNPDAIDEMLARTAGMWAGPEFDDIEKYLAEARQQWDEEWQQRVNSLLNFNLE